MVKPSIPVENTLDPYEVDTYSVGQRFAQTFARTSAWHRGVH
jgi:hypothetical protein